MLSQNPVFAHRASFRKLAKALQLLLLLLALFAGLIGLCGLLLKTLGIYAGIPGGWCLLGMCVLLTMSLLWGYLWRRALQRSFKTQYALENSSR